MQHPVETAYGGFSAALKLLIIIRLKHKRQENYGMHSYY